MKLDKLMFAKVVAHCVANGMTTGEYALNELDQLIEVPEPKPNMASAGDVDRLLMLMAQGQQKIEAIKQYRTMTGSSLKEAKDAVERHWVAKPIMPGMLTGF